MKQDWYNLRYNFIGSDYDLPWLVDFYMKQASFIAYKNIEAIRNYLIIFDYEVPEMIEDYLENSEHQNINPGQKRSSSDKKLRDMGIYLHRNYNDINHGKKQQYYSNQADELGLLDEKHLAERCNQVKKLFAQHEPGYIQLEYKFLMQKANEKELSGRRASRYVETIIAKKCHLSKAEVRRIVTST